MIIIPARLQSTRFPEKILANIGGVPMVVATAQRVMTVDQVVVAADDVRVVEIVRGYGIDAVLTGVHHQSGTDRLFEACEILGLNDHEMIINVQADEPFIEEEVVRAVKRRLQGLDRGFRMASAYKIIDAHAARDPNLVKVVTDDEGDAIYFSRSMIPYDRDGVGVEYKGHLGIYGYTVATLRRFCGWPTSDLEKIEKLEQLRALTYGKKIAMVEVATEGFGIDTKEDWERAQQRLATLQ
ncbi:MAG: 3-deoxy-manno-octulosonate cytidylyltransferase [Campylobacterales bacterium]